MKRLFTEHPATVGESYTQHFGVATRFGMRMCIGGLACLLHGIFPFLFKSTGSETICDLHNMMVVNRKEIRRISSDLRTENSAPNYHAYDDFCI